MNKLPQMASVADMRNRHLELFKKLDNGPVLIANRSKASAVIMSPETWNSIVETMDEQYDRIQMLEALLERATGVSKPHLRDHAEIDAWVNDEQSLLS